MATPRVVVVHRRTEYDELIARHVAPRFQGSLTGIDASNAVARARATITGRERTAAVEGAQVAYERERGTIR